MAKMLWWGYLHNSGTIHTKRFFSQGDIDEAKASPFVNEVFGPWEVENKAEAEKRIREEADKRISFIHSKCHNAHWELSINSKGIYNLTCEKCGLPIGPSIVVMGNTDVKAGDCDICKTMRKP